MTTTTRTATAPAPSAPPRPHRPSAARRARRWISEHSVMLAAIAALLYLFLPVAYTLAFSFNDHGRSNIVWQGFTWEHWQDPCGVAGACESLVTSLQVATISTLVATVLGTLMALAMVRYRYRGKAASNVLIFVPMATPEIVMGAALLTIFVQGFSDIGIDLGFGTIVFSHIMFCLSFVVVTVKARIQSLDPRIEEAAQDLYASPVQTFWKVTFPLILPGIAGAAMLAFSLSFDDFIITNFVSGNENTFPKFVYVASRRGIPAEANVIGFSMFVLAVLLVIGAQVVGSARSSRSRGRSRSE
ncbi:ABC transporter permease [Nocardioides xinjiangensis]|uniref:ABC transporter permease n=1 Tax=Nocardioides xinjiangensis TaxID=2817376 RepID=UPI001B30B3D6|nr:ABC transporter permease [Nocardioides sp. SYSU D00514]